MQEEGLIYDWNAQGASASRPVKFCDKTLRDGLQSPSVRTPHIEEKLRILRLIESLEIETAMRYALDSGLPGAFVMEDTTRSRPEVVRKLYSEAVS